MDFMHVFTREKIQQEGAEQRNDRAEERVHRSLNGVDRIWPRMRAKPYKS